MAQATTHNRPNGRLQSKFAPKPPMHERIKLYQTSETNCTCPANRYNPGPCKHIRALKAAISQVKAAGFELQKTPTEPKSALARY